MLLFGWGHRTRKNYGEAFPIKCPNCKNAIFLNFLRVRTWFTLFFIPVIPYETKNMLLCPVCSRGKELDSSQIEHAKKASEITQKFINKEIKEITYQKNMDKYAKLLLDE